MLIPNINSNNFLSLDAIPNTCISSDGKILTCDDHHDTGLITLLETFNNGGLEVIGEGGEWMC